MTNDMEELRRELAAMREEADILRRRATDAEEALAAFKPTFEAAHAAGMRRKLGLLTEQEGDAALAGDLLAGMHANNADFTNTFRQLTDAASGEPGNAAGVRSLLRDESALDEWLGRWRQRLAQEPTDAATRAANMRVVNPAFIPRNHRVEAMIRAAVDNNDFAPFEELLGVLLKPYENRPEFVHYTEPPQEHQRVRATFCGT